MSAEELESVERFDFDALDALARESAERYAWLEKEGHGITGDSAPPPIPLGIHRGEPAKSGEAYEQAQELQKNDPPPSGEIWHLSPAGRDQLAKQFADPSDLERVLRLLESQDPLKPSDHKASRMALAVAALVAVAAPVMIILSQVT